MQYKQTRRKASECSTIHFSIPECIITPGKAIRTPQDILDSFKGLSRIPVEIMVQVVLNAKNNLIGVFLLGVGIKDACLVDPQACARNMAISNGSSCIIVHNHPSGDTTASCEDIRVTRSISEAVKVMGSKVIDHIIIGHKDNEPSSLSMREKGLLALN